MKSFSAWILLQIKRKPSFWNIAKKINGSNSSNSRRLVEIACDSGCRKAVLIERAGELDPLFLDGVRTLGLTSGASTPEVLVAELIEHLSGHFQVNVEEIVTATEEIQFRLPASRV